MRTEAKLAAIERLARELMDQHGLVDWKLEWSHRFRSTFGDCNYGKKTIRLNTRHAALDRQKDIRDTILHEIAHALVGVGHGHDRVWREKASSIGCDNLWQYLPLRAFTPNAYHRTIYTRHQPCPRKYATNAERQRAYRERLRISRAKARDEHHKKEKRR